jgi:hypothetical protein
MNETLRLQAIEPERNTAAELAPTWSLWWSVYINCSTVASLLTGAGHGTELGANRRSGRQRGTTDPTGPAPAAGPVGSTPVPAAIRSGPAQSSARSPR